MKKILSVLLFAAFLALCVGAHAQSEVIVPGNPPITLHDADCQIRLLEFVLQTRLTVAQKDFFLEQFKLECKDMTAEEKEDTLSAAPLCVSLSQLDEEDTEEIRSDLEKDYLEGAKETSDDPASELFLKLRDENVRVVLSGKDCAVSVQAMQAFCEYLAFVASPDKPAAYDAKTVDFINGMMRGSFEAMKQADKEALDEFQLTWYMIRAAWQNTPDGEKKNSWRRRLALCGLKSGEVPTVKNIRDALSDSVYGTMLDEAVSMGVEPTEWASQLTVRVW